MPVSPPSRRVLARPRCRPLVKSGKVNADWACNDTHGMVTDSVVVLAVRPGNPKNIHTWNDLLQPGVGIITPNPLTSGSAKWNVMAAFGAWKKEGSPTIRPSRT